METVQIKYDNFLKFITEAVSSNNQSTFWLSLLASVPLETFLRGIYEQSEAEPGLTIEQITDKVLDRAGLQRKDFTGAQIEKFSLYCEYFLQISRQIYKK
jgi:hypothetical protein